MEPSDKVRTSLPENYVTLLDLRERWMQRQKQKEEVVVISDKSPEKSIIGSNPNPRIATGRASNGQFPSKKRNGRRIQNSQPKSPNAVQLVEAKPLPQIRVNQTKPSLLKSPKVESDIDLRDEARRSSKKVADNQTTGEIERKLEDLSLSSGVRSVRFKKDRAKRESGFVWVKKGESS